MDTYFLIIYSFCVVTWYLVAQTFIFTSEHVHILFSNHFIHANQALMMEKIMIIKTVLLNRKDTCTFIFVISTSFMHKMYKVKRVYRISRTSDAYVALYITNCFGGVLKAQWLELCVVFWKMLYFCTIIMPFGFHFCLKDRSRHDLQNVFKKKLVFSDVF